MNKKFITPLMVILGIGLVVAGGYYVLSSDTFNVNNIIGMGTYEEDIGSVEFGNTIDGTLIELDNNLINDRNLLITSAVSDTEGTSDDIAIEYKANLELTKKDVDFTKDVWIYDIEDAKVQVEYTVVGDSFSAEVTIGSDDDYVLIYYPDNDDRFENPSEAWPVDLMGEEFDSLPAIWDWNYGEPYSEDYDYCSTGEYTNCHGAKIWYVPSNAINNDGTLDWSRASEFLFETELIQYNAEGDIIVYAGTSITIMPEFTPDDFAEGEYTIETTVA